MARIARALLLASSLLACADDPPPADPPGGLSLLADALVNKLTSFSNPCETVRSSIKK